MNRGIIISPGEDVPDGTGVYLMRNSKGAVVYVGKALSFKHRMSAHFSGGSLIDTSDVVSVELIHCHPNVQASRERMLIQRHQPRMNVRLKSDNYVVKRRGRRG